MIKVFEDREDAGRQLAKKLIHLKGRPDVIVMGLPRGGVVVAGVIARQLNQPLDIVCVRKLGVPQQKELAMGAVAMGGIRLLNEEILNDIAIDAYLLDQTIDQEMKELARREKAYRGKREYPQLRGKVIVLVDDGIATGATMRASIMAVKHLRAAKIIVASPVIDTRLLQKFKMVVDDIVTVEETDSLGAIGLWYRDFAQVEDFEVQNILNQFYDSENGNSK